MKSFVVLSLLVAVVFGASSRSRRSYDTVHGSENDNGATDNSDGGIKFETGDRPKFVATDYSPLIAKTCNDVQCLNGGKCIGGEIVDGFNFHCSCARGCGGRLCEIENPCEANPCPYARAKCIRGITTPQGRFCLDPDTYELMDEQ